MAVKPTDLRAGNLTVVQDWFGGGPKSLKHLRPLLALFVWHQVSNFGRPGRYGPKRL